MKKNFRALKGRIVAKGLTIKDVATHFNIDYQKLQKQLNGGWDVPPELIKDIQSYVRSFNGKNN